ncbi:NAD(P)/FAD-dependent oxidoreductase [Natronobacterium gregoryi]|uniref:FAD-dependent pyridine nucleotide-disulfide oxidoreductase n=2 Tax=Natronobacterium gregoryi TaxID=44930 RepID=L0AMJ6_NATGS|nr:NAD(P)/FAD-dependent oxidoreductase [Natronobacterium gregoryi]AFZ74285.1 thioredoxin reductase [Natronobacterium gregoryi SP2]ELY63744.1 FAD-dependent pyridine nucleotide-disulfide oxidoreductase [Natronobacterium gregoryi SP2]PLK22206.1 NAD(P)/FAD-dependent oxidoreductase [Natronobacterium gregoryi SP2]SFI52987.1 thioredoxin reductase (NADPH) [Natronobacterium gregoryi]
MSTDDGFDYDVVVVGGGPAGLTSALYTTRLSLDTLVIDRGGGRAAMMRETHNVIGITEETSGNELLQTAREQVQGYGADFERGLVESVTPLGDSADDGFRVETGDASYHACRVVLATGFADERPDPPLPPTGRGLHYCLLCDAYMFVDEPVYVMGAGDAAARVAMIMLNYTDAVDLLTRGEDPSWSDETATMLEHHPVDVVTAEIAAMNKSDDGWLESFEFADGQVRAYSGGFLMYGSDYHDEVVEGLDLERTEDGAVAVDDYGRTSVDGVYAVGDLTPGYSQIPIAMGEGANAGITIHKELRAFPRSLEELETDGPVTDADVPALSAALAATAVEHEGHAHSPTEPADE